MSFLDSFPEDQRALFMGGGARMELAKGRYLLRRGEPGGDVYLLEAGTLEVVDTRSTPELILVVVPEGRMVGEMAFIDDSPRSADVRAATDVSVWRWARDDLRSMLLRNPELGVTFYKAVARYANDRIRVLTDGAVSGAFSSSDAPGATFELVETEIRSIAERAKARLLAAETLIRADPNDASAAMDLAEVLDDLQTDLSAHFASLEGSDAGRFSAEILCRELHPYLVRASLAERCIRRPQGVIGTAEILSHVLVGTPTGEGRLGQLLDQWLLKRPTMAALRRFRDPIAELVRTRLPEHRNRRVTVLNAGTGSLVASVIEATAGLPTVLTVVDQSRDALGYLDGGALPDARGVEVRTLQTGLAGLALGRSPGTLPPQDCIVVHGILEYLPERLAVSLLGTIRGLLSRDGRALVATLGPSDDQALLDRLLTWPTIRRRRDSLHNIAGAGGLRVEVDAELEAPATLLSLVAAG